MMNEIILTFPYILIYLPLLFSIFCYFLTNKKILSIVSIAIILLMILISYKILLNLKIDSNYFVITLEKLKFIGNNFNINIRNITLLISILIVHLIYIINLVNEDLFIKNKNSDFAKIFFSIYFIFIFSNVGILLTYNIFHLFLFIEIFAFSGFNILSSYKNKKINEVVYKYYANNIFGSFLLVIAVFYTAVYFNTNNNLNIKQQIMTVSLIENRFIILIAILMVMGTILTFLMFNVKSISYKKREIGFLAIMNIFISGAIGIYIIDYYLNNVFNIIISNYLLNIVYIVLSFMIIYSIYLAFAKKSINVFNLFITFVRINMCFCVLSIIIPDKRVASTLIILNTFDHCTVNFFVYLTSIYLSEIYNDNNYNLLNKKESYLLKIIIILILIYKIYIPGTISYFSLNTLYKYFANTNNYCMLVTLALYMILITIFLIRFIINRNKIEEVQLIDFNKKRVYYIKISLILCLVFIIVGNFVFNKYILANMGLN